MMLESGARPPDSAWCPALKHSSLAGFIRHTQEDMAHNVYVVELDPAVRERPQFAAANPDARPDKPCLYVGLTGLSPEKRFERHKAGIQASAIVKRFGLRLRPRFYQRYNPMPYDEAVGMEGELARRLRKRGFAVWQN